ncbi:MAG: PilZ domain-containing protein [Candidatus Acidiferrales bacterium]
MSPSDPQISNKTTQLRRSQRVCLRLPILVLREGPGTNVASEETHTLMVNAHGALIQLALTVEIGQLLRVKNTQTMEQLVCRVVNLGAEQAGKREVGVEFENPAPRFWRVTFPPADWTPRSPDAKAPTKHLPGGRAQQRKAEGVPAEVDKKPIKKLPGHLPS